MNIRGKSFAILGAARSGVAVAKLLRRHRAKVFLSEMRPCDDVRDAMTELEALGVTTECGGHTGRVVEHDYLIPSPGVPSDTPMVKLAREKGLEVMSEIEIAYHFCAAPIVAITGSNGKTTTTTLVGEMMKRAGLTTAVCGNIGFPFSDAVDELPAEKSVAVLEVSSFQLDHIDNFRANIAAILNISPDHLDRYQSYEEYIQAKLRIAENQKGSDVFIYNEDDIVLAPFAETLAVKTLGFSTEKNLSYGAWVDEGTIKVRMGRAKAEEFMSVTELALPGKHNLANALAATLVARSFGVEEEPIRQTLKTFQGVEHRLEFVRELDGVRYVNDSKATNVDSVRYALEAFESKIILIVGGRDKGASYEPIVSLSKDRVRAVVLIGEATEKIEKAFAGTTKTIRAGSMDDAVKRARKIAERGDVVLLSPACSSFDMFKNYEERGKIFKEIVHKL